MRLFLTVPFLLAASGCTPAANPETSGENTAAAAGPVGETPPAALTKQDASEPYSEKLQWMLERTAFAQDPDTPCLRREIERPAWTEDPAVSIRLREVRSDSHWLGRWARENLGDRLAYAMVTYDWTPKSPGDVPLSAPPLVYQIAVTGDQPVNAPPLGDRARGVLVKILYDVPYSHAEFMERRRIGSEASREWIDKIGEGGSPENGWAVRMDVYSDDGQPDPEVLAQCDRLRRAYDLPILMEFSNARITTDVGG